MTRLRRYEENVELIFKILYFLLAAGTFCPFIYDSSLQPILVKMVLGVGGILLFLRAADWKHYIRMPGLSWMALFVLSFLLSSFMNRRYGMSENFKWMIWMILQMGCLYTCKLDRSRESYEKEFRILSHVMLGYSMIAAIAKIGKEYEKRYPQTYRVISKTNGGHGSTINCGIEQSRGTFFKVVDGDDWVNTEALIEVVRRLKTCGADYVVTDYCEVNDKTKEQVRKQFPALDVCREIRFENAAEKVQIPMHALIIRTDLLKTHQIRLDEHCFYVDVEYVLFPVPYVETVVYYPEPVYMYRLAQETQSVSIRGYQRHIQDHIRVIFHLSQFFEEYRENAGNSEKTAYIARRIAQMIGDQVTIFLSFPEENTETQKQFLEFDRQLRKTSKTIYELSGRESGTLRLLRRTGFRGYRLIRKLARKRNNMEE